MGPEDINPRLKEFSSVIQSQEKDVLLLLRKQLKRDHWDDPEYETKLQLLEGQIAIRDME